MTGIFNLRLPKPKLSFAWDVDILFRYFGQLGDNCLLVIRYNFNTESYDPTAAAYGSQTQYN